MELRFIQDEHLKQRIENAITYIFILYVEEKKSENILYKKETYRVIILYAVSIIEAVLFYLYEKREQTITKREYKNIQYLSEQFSHREVTGKIMVAVECERDKKESEITLRELIDFLVIQKVIRQETANRLGQLLEKRNSIHLRSTQDNDYSVKDVDEALDLLAYVISHTPRRIR